MHFVIVGGSDAGPESDRSKPRATLRSTRNVGLTSPRSIAPT
jgi:hypothetical protein